MPPPHRSNIRETNKHPEPLRYPDSPTRNRFTEKNRDPTGRRALGYASVTREVYAHPLKPVTKSENAGLTPSATSIVTKRPTSFTIPLRKSIRVSNPVANRQQPIQTTGYIKESAMGKVPYHRTTQNQKHSVFDDRNLKQSTAQTEHDVTSFGDYWRPKRLTTVPPSYKATTFVRPSKPIPFTRFSDAMAAIENRNKVGDRRGRPNPPLPSPSSKDQTRSEINGARRNTGSENKETVQTDADGLLTKFPSRNKENVDTLVFQSTKAPSGANRQLADSRKPNHPVMIKHYRDNLKDTTTTDEVTIGVEYADAELNRDLINAYENSNEQQSRNKIIGQSNSKSSEFQFERSTPNKAHGNGSKDEDIASANDSNSNVLSNSGIDKIVDKSREYVLNSKNLANHKEFKNQNRDSSEEVDKLTPNTSKVVSAEKSGSYVRYDGYENHSDKDTETESGDVEPHSAIETNTNKKLFDNSVPSKSNKVDIPNFDNPIVRSDSYDREKDSEIPMAENFPKTPFYGEVIRHPYNQDYPKDITDDKIYFPQIFPDTNIGIQNHRNGSDGIPTKHTSVHITKNNYVDKERLIEINPKETKDQNKFPIYLNQAKAVTISDYSSLRSYSPTSPTVNSDSSDRRRPSNVILDPKRGKDASNKTSNYVLHRTPVLSPEMPGYSYPRKPNIRLTPGMLAGILIAALIFLGFLTGIYFVLIKH